MSTPKELALGKAQCAVITCLQFLPSDTTGIIVKLTYGNNFL